MFLKVQCINIDMYFEDNVPQSTYQGILICTLITLYQGLIDMYIDQCIKAY